ncbi:MAG TPA: beta-ketoacyl-ACP synthase 3 [Solirubrobacteraceae bacterium]|nr:beta-ketoacyl-ACP synthase 3 [Solirubrobacteraceae bacterium]
MLESPDVAGRAASALAETMPAHVTRAAFHSIAIELPPGRLSSAEVAARLEISEEWILSRTGIHERPMAGPDERLSDYAARAGAAALARAGVDGSELDLVLVATISADEVTPNTAPLVAHALGAHRAGAFDIGSACTGFLSAVAIAAAAIESGRARWVLVVGADFITRMINWEDRKSAALFGDAAGAAVLGPADGEHGVIGPIVLGADGSNGETIMIPNPERKIVMDGPEVYKHAVARMAESTLAALDRSGMTIDDIDLFVYHQANARITQALGERLGVEPERVVDCIAHYGNSSAATLPLALASAERDGRLKPGARVVLGAFGGGFTWGGGVIEWGASGDA